MSLLSWLVGDIEPVIGLPNALAINLNEDECFRKEAELPVSEIAPSVKWEAKPWGEHGEASEELQYQVEDTRAEKNRTYHALKYGPYERITARFVYPSESLPPPVLSPLPSSATPNAVGWTTSFARHLMSLLTLFSILTQVLRYANLYIKRYLLSSLFSTRLVIDKTPDPYIKSKTEARTKDEQKHTTYRTLTEKVVRVIAVVVKEADNAQEEYNARLFEMKAKHKRVRDIMRASGYRVDEEVYKMEIRAALRKLKG